IVDLLGLGRDAPFHGQSLVRYWSGDPGATGPPSEPLLMETTKPAVMVNEGREPVAKGPMKALVAGGMDYIRAGDGSEELYSHRADAEVRFNLAGAPAAREALQGFRARLAEIVRKR